MVSKEEIPEHWGWKKLEDIGEIYSGGTPDRDNESYFGGEIPWLRLKDAKNFYVSSAKENLTKKGLNNSSAQLLPEGTVIVSTRATIGRVTVAKAEVATNQGFKSVYPEECIPEFVAYYMNSIEEELNQKGRTTTYAEVNKTQFKNTKIPVPPLNEQKAIVEKLDEIFDSIEEIQDAQEQIEELEEKLLRSVIKSKIPHNTLPDGWEKKKIKEIGEVISGGTPSRDNEEYFGGDIPWLRLGDVKSFYVEDSEENITQKGLENSSAQLIPEDSVIVSTRATIGEVSVNKTPLTTNQGFKTLHPKNAVPEFIAYYMISIADLLEKKGRTTTYPEVNKTQFSNITIPLPSKDKQSSIVRKIDQVREMIDNIKDQNSMRLDITKDLPKSVLAEAFKGDLVDLNSETDSSPYDNVDYTETEIETEGQQKLGEFD